MSYERVVIPGMGLATRAVRDIKYGELIFEDDPIIRIDKSLYLNEPDKANVILWDKYNNLSLQEKSIINGLHDISQATPTDPKSIWGVFNSNNVCTGCDPAEVGLYPRYSLLNHSCRSNVKNTCSSNGTLRVYAVRDIKAGEELYTRYADVLKTYAERQAHLKEHWGFDCTCELCSLPVEERQASDRRVTTVRELLNSTPTSVNAQEAYEYRLKVIVEILEIVRQEYPPYGLPQLNSQHAFHAYQYALKLFDTEAAKKYINMAYKNSLICYGEKHPETQAMFELLKQSF